MAWHWTFCAHTCTRTLLVRDIPFLVAFRDGGGVGGDGGGGEVRTHGKIPSLGRAFGRFELASTSLAVKHAPFCRLHVASSPRSCEIVACCSSSRVVQGESCAATLFDADDSTPGLDAGWSARTATVSAKRATVNPSPCTKSAAASIEPMGGGEEPYPHTRDCANRNPGPTTVQGGSDGLQTDQAEWHRHIHPRSFNSSRIRVFSGSGRLREMWRWLFMLMLGAVHDRSFR